MTELNEELLVAYVDGQLAEDQSKAIERVLEEGRDCIAVRRGRHTGRVFQRYRSGKFGSLHSDVIA